MIYIYLYVYFQKLQRSTQQVCFGYSKKYFDIVTFILDVEINTFITN